jgi:hypothetical protein
MDHVGRSAEILPPVHPIALRMSATPLDSCTGCGKVSEVLMNDPDWVGANGKAPETGALLL